MSKSRNLVILLSFAFLLALQLNAEAETTSVGEGKVAGEKMTLKIEGVDFTFCWCPPGEFKMGSPASEDGRYKEEKQHQVELTKGFWLLESEVSQEMWERVMGTTIQNQRDKADFKIEFSGVGANYPMCYVTWEECQEFCKKLSELSGVEVTLPTEAQWEYACRAGSEAAFGGTNDLDGMGWYKENSNNSLHEIKQKEPNAWGLYDMHGNVWEWCFDCYKENYYTKSPNADPKGPQENSTDKKVPLEEWPRVNRGGCWRTHTAIYCRSAYRSSDVPWDRTSYLGFRPALIPAEN